MNPESDPIVNASPGKMIRVGAAKGDLAAEAAEASYGHNGTIYSLLSLPLPFRHLPTFSHLGASPPPRNLKRTQEA